MRTKPTSQGKSLLDTYLTYHNLTLRSTTSQEPKRDGMPFMPMLLMDAMNLLYEEYIAPLPLRHAEKQLRTRWHEAYKHYISQEFMAFDDDQKCEICDIMDDFGKAIHNEVEIFRATVMSKFMSYDTDVRLILSASVACNLLAQAAEWIWEALRGRRCPNAYITAVVEWSHKFLNEYGDKRIDRNTKGVDLSKFSDLQCAVNRISKKIAECSERLAI